jgi:hypothetical protein
MAAAPRVDPILLGYGDTFGTFAGNRLGDTDIYSDSIDSSKLGENLLSDVIEFTPFEETVRDYILGNLGYPVVRVELTDFQLKTSIDEAITYIDYHAPFWATQMAAFSCSGGINQYILPQHIANNLNYVVYKKTLLSIQNQAGTLEFDFFIKYFQDNFLFSDFDIPGWYMTQMHLESVRKILSQEGSWDLINGNVLQLAPTPVQGEDVIVVYRGLNTGTMHPFYKKWIKKYALAVAKGILGEIRGKFSSLPSPGGGASLNGAALLQASEKEKEMLQEQLLSEIEEPPVFTMF